MKAKWLCVLLVLGAFLVVWSGCNNEATEAKETLYDSDISHDPWNYNATWTVDGFGPVLIKGISGDKNQRQFVLPIPTDKELIEIIDNIKGVDFTLPWRKYNIFIYKAETFNWEEVEGRVLKAIIEYFGCKENKGK